MRTVFALALALAFAAPAGAQELTVENAPLVGVYAVETHDHNGWFVLGVDQNSSCLVGYPVPAGQPAPPTPCTPGVTNLITFAEAIVENTERTFGDPDHVGEPIKARIVTWPGREVVTRGQE